ncbi:MAG: hypothetical protein S4CHLAM123_02050 [Chlamydiales bacterium]|nr:hypothetical protein [Chlamydiales bacterium]
MIQRFFLLLTLIAFTSACSRVPTQIEPTVHAPPHPKKIQREKRVFLYLPEDFSLTPFSALSCDERCTDWGKEYLIALSFAEDFDLYRAITGFKRALCLLPSDQIARCLEIEYAIALAYFLGEKYVEVVYTVESTGLVNADATFPAFDDLLLILYESYENLGRTQYAEHILNLIDQQDPSICRKLQLLSMVKQADLNQLHCYSQQCPDKAYLENILYGYQRGAKSIRKAEWLNALLPGAGYWYVGLRNTAVTAFLINGLFIAAATSFFIHGHPAAGAFTASLEGGWYFGGITGAGYAAKYYNEQLYCAYADKIGQKEEYYPILMLKYSF